jgi:glycosyltransferase involved in cell wall biosynthesis
MALVSVIVCSHNPRDAYLLRCLNGLRSQTLDMKSWELLLIDNGSDSPLKLKGDISWHPNSRHVRESNLGLVWARCRGIQESVGEILILVDDDNVLDSDYLFKASELGRKWPILGAWGAGLISPEFEVEPAPHLKDFLHSLALRGESNSRWSNVLPCAEATPWGAGLCVRGSVAEAYLRLGQESKHLITGRIGNVLLSGDDIELCYIASKLGFGVGIFPELKVLHLIPQERISESYLVKIGVGTGISNVLLDCKWFGIRPRSSLSLRSLLALGKNILTKRGIHRRMYIAKWRAAITARKRLKI